MNDYIDKIKVRGTTYDVADTDGRAAIAPDYADLTFPVKKGAFCWHSGTLYTAKQDIDTSETWTASHWNTAVLGNELAERVGDLKSELGDISEPYGYNLFNPLTIKPNTTINTTTGVEEQSANYWVSEFIAIDPAKKIGFCGFEKTGSTSARIYFYDSNKEFISRITSSSIAFTTGLIGTPPTGSAYVKICEESATNQNGYVDPFGVVVTQSETSSIPAYVAYAYALDKTARNMNASLSAASLKALSATGITDADDITENSFCYLSGNTVANTPSTGAAWYIVTTKFNDNNLLQVAYNARGVSAFIRAKVTGTWGNWAEFTISESSTSYVTKTEAYETSTIALFPSVGCCGDSFTAGYLYNKTDSPYYDPDYVPNGEYPSIGYPAVMGRLYGVDVTAFAKGGLTTTAYRTDAKGLPALVADTAKDLYIICLGLNDKTQDIPIGVEADIDTEPATPTYLGNMGAIIRAITTHAPLAKIILMKSPWVFNAGGSSANNYYNYSSAAIELLSSHLGIPYLETLNDPYFCSNAYVNGLKGLHPTAPLYAGMGKRIGELVGKCVIDNPEYFYNFYVPNA